MKWKTYDKWHLTTQEIMADTGAAGQAVSHARKRYAPDTINKSHEGYDWAKVDWGKRTKDIAEELGCNQTVVSGARRRYAPETKSDWRTTKKRASVYRAEKEFLDYCDE